MGAATSGMYSVVSSDAVLRIPASSRCDSCLDDFVYGARAALDWLARRDHYLVRRSQRFFGALKANLGGYGPGRVGPLYFGDRYHTLHN
jgi:hypothetical protein